MTRHSEFWLCVLRARTIVNLGQTPFHHQAHTITYACIYSRVLSKGECFEREEELQVQLNVVVWYVA